MSAAVIVAIPSRDDRVWRVSSEKVPHLTLLYLGEDMEPTQVTRIAEFLDHAATTLSPFYMDVDYRDELGDDKADVLFLKKSWGKKVEAFRSQLLGNPEIAKAYNSVEQFPEWTPHVTLGYPETPAKPDDRDSFYLVSFDRLALWVGDFEGPEFRLEHEEYGDELAMSENLDNFLAHYGVKGMRWGIRRTDAQLALLNRQKAKLDQKQFKLDKKASKLGADKVAVDVIVDKNGKVVSTEPAKSKGSSDEAPKSSEGGRSAEPSADAVRFAELSLKQPIEMSNSEIKLLTERARLTSEYNKIFANPSANNELREKVESMRLEKEYKQLKAQMTPPSKTKAVARSVGNFVKTAAVAYGHFKTLDKATGGAMSKELKVGMGLQTKYKGKHVAKVAKVKKKKK